MIFDSLKNSALYYPVSPRLEKAFGFIASTDWETMEPGIHELDGKDIYVNVMEPELKKPADAKLEIHDAYIDIQVLIRGEQETFGWSERADLRKRLAESSPGKDTCFFDDEPQTFYTLRPGQFTIFFPEDGHAPDDRRGQCTQDHCEGSQVTAGRITDAREAVPCGTASRFAVMLRRVFGVRAASRGRCSRRCRRQGQSPKQKLRGLCRYVP